MIADMQASEAASRQKAAASKSAEDAAEIARMEKQVRVQNERFLERKKSGGLAASRVDGDWTDTYRKWDGYVDEDELRTAKEKQAEMATAASRRSQMGGCSHDHSAERRLMDMSTDEKLEGCERFRAEGAEWFAEGQYLRAGEKFHRALVWLEYTFASDDDDGDEQARVDEARLSALVNFAVCKLKVGDIDEVISNAYQALKLDPENVKALYCRAKAYRMKDDFEKAGEDVSAALRLDPFNAALRKEAAILKNKIRAYRIRTKQVSKAMFGGTSASGGGEKENDSEIDLDDSDDEENAPALVGIYRKQDASNTKKISQKQRAAAGLTRERIFAKDNGHLAPDGEVDASTPFESLLPPLRDAVKTRQHLFQGTHINWAREIMKLILGAIMIAAQFMGRISGRRERRRR